MRIPMFIIDLVAALNDCSQQEGICDRHAFCLGSLHVNECNAKVNPCEGQQGNHCVNIDGGYICCEEGVEEDVCIREKGAFCSGGCGTHAVCYNETCQCMEGFEGDARVKCDDINECENDKQCAGVGEWCVNMIGGYICCGEDSKEEECKANYLIHSADGNATMPEHGHEAKGVIRSESSGSIAHRSSGDLIFTNGKIITDEFVEIACDIGCPPDSHCENGTCHCNVGFAGNTNEGCHDIDECERNPCTEPGSWCVNSPGSFQCCTTESNMSDCIGLEIVAGDGLRLAGVDSNKSNVAEWSSNGVTTGERKGEWKVETIGEWRNFSGGAIIIGRGKIENGMWNISEGEGEEQSVAIINGKKEAERLLSLIGRLQKGSGSEAFKTVTDNTTTNATDGGGLRFVVTGNGFTNKVSSGSMKATPDGSGTFVVENVGGNRKEDSREDGTFKSGNISGERGDHVAIAIGGSQETPILSMNGTITGRRTGDTATSEELHQEAFGGRSLQTGTDADQISTGEKRSKNKGDHMMVAVGRAPGGQNLEMSGTISVGGSKSIAGDREGEEQSLSSKTTTDTSKGVTNTVTVSGKGEKEPEITKVIITTGNGNARKDEGGDLVQVILHGTNKEPLFKMNGTELHGSAMGISKELSGHEIKRTGGILGGSGRKSSEQGGIDGSRNEGRIFEGSNVRWNGTKVIGETTNINIGNASFKSGQSSESSHGEISIEKGGSLIIKNVGQPQVESKAVKPTPLVPEARSTDKISSEEGPRSTNPLVEATTSGNLAFSMLITQAPLTPDEGEGNAAVHKEVLEASVAPKIAITKSKTKSTDEEGTEVTNAPLLTTAGTDFSEITETALSSETTHETTTEESRSTDTRSGDTEKIQTTSEEAQEINQTTEGNEKGRSSGKKETSQTPTPFDVGSERKEKIDGATNEGKSDGEQTLVEQKTTMRITELGREDKTSSWTERPATIKAEEGTNKQTFTVAPKETSTTAQVTASQTTAEQATTSKEESTTEEPSSKTSVVETKIEHSTIVPKSQEKIFAATSLPEMETSTKERKEASTPTSSSDKHVVTTASERQEEGLSTSSMEPLRKTSSKPSLKISEELPGERDEHKATLSEKMNTSSTTDASASSEVTTAEFGEKTTTASTLESASTTAGNKPGTTAAAVGETEENLLPYTTTKESSRTTTTTTERSSTTLSKDGGGGGEETGGTTDYAKTGPGSVVRGGLETTTPEHGLETASTLKPESESEVTTKAEGEAPASRPEGTTALEKEHIAESHSHTTGGNEQSTTKKPEEAVMTTNSEKRGSTLNASKESSTSEPSKTQETTIEYPIESQKTTIGGYTGATEQNEKETYTTDHVHETTQGSLGSIETATPKPISKFDFTKETAYETTTEIGVRETASTVSAVSETITKASKEVEDKFGGETDAITPKSRGEISSSSFTESSGRYESATVGATTSESPDEEIIQKPAEGKQEGKGGLEAATTEVAAIGAEKEGSKASVTPETTQSSTTGMSEASTKESLEGETTAEPEDKVKTFSQSTGEQSSTKPSAVMGPSTASPEEESSVSSISIQGTATEHVMITTSSASITSEEQQPPDGRGAITSLETSSSASKQLIGSNESENTASTIGSTGMTISPNQHSLSVEKAYNETTQEPKGLEEEVRGSTSRGEFGSTPLHKEKAEILSTRTNKLSSTSEPSTMQEAGLEIAWVSTSSTPEITSMSTSQNEKSTTAVYESSTTYGSPSTLSLETTTSELPGEDRKTSSARSDTSITSAATLSIERFGVTSETHLATSGGNGSALTAEEEYATTVSAAMTTSEGKTENELTISVTSTSFSAGNVGSSTRQPATSVFQTNVSGKGSGADYFGHHTPSTSASTTSKEETATEGYSGGVEGTTTQAVPITTEEEDMGGLTKTVGKEKAIHTSMPAPSEEPIEAHRSTLESVPEPDSSSVTTTAKASETTTQNLQRANIATETFQGTTKEQLSGKTEEKLVTGETPEVEQHHLYTSTEETLKSSTYLLSSVAEGTIRSTTEEGHRKEMEEEASTTTKASAEASTSGIAHVTTDSSETGEAAPKDEEISQKVILTSTAPADYTRTSSEDTTLASALTAEPESESRRTAAEGTSVSTSVPKQHASTETTAKSETSETAETSETPTQSTVGQASSASPSGSETTGETTETSFEKIFSKSSEASGTKEPITTEEPIMTEKPTTVKEEILRKEVSEPSKVNPLDEQTQSAGEHGLEIVYWNSTTVEQPTTTLPPPTPESENERKEDDGGTTKGESRTSEHSAEITQSDTTTAASETSTAFPATTPSQQFKPVVKSEEATSPSSSQFTTTSEAHNDLTTPMRTMIGTSTNLQSKSTAASPSIPVDSAEVGETTPREEGIASTTTTSSIRAESSTNGVTSEYAATTESASNEISSTTIQKTEKEFGSTERSSKGTTLEAIGGGSSTAASMSTTSGTVETTMQPTSVEVTERVHSTTDFETKGKSGVEATTFRSTDLMTNSDTGSTQEATTSSDGAVIRVTLEETVAPKIAILPEKWKTTKEVFSLKTTTEQSSTNTSFKTVRCLSSDQCGPDAYCERRSGACRCFPGFTGEPPQMPCTDVDECERNLDDCHSSARCWNFIGGYTCFCETGFRKDSNGVCVDIDECRERAGSSCHPRAVCTNLPGSYSCVCTAGYVGDGYTCIPLEKRHCTPEEWEKMDCGRNHLCLVDGRDIDECADPETNVCHADAICKNIVGSFMCQCQPGFKGDGFECLDVDECQQNPCHPHATCINFPGSYTCKCPDGWEGDGTNECINPLDKSCLNKEKVCKRANHTSCISTKLNELVSVCECDANYRYNTQTGQCEDINECDENRHSCDPSTSVCVNTEGGYICECAAGYEGIDGICVDVDECERGQAGCNIAARCENYIGSVGCKCGPGYTGDGIDCTPISVDTSSVNTCSSDWIKLCHAENKTCHIDDEDVPQCGSCLNGHQPVGGRCLPINGVGNCADPQKNDCDPNADCIDVHPGRHFCACKPGFIGDGRRCDDVDECSLPGVCDAAADCHNTNGSFTCVCQPGYSGNGFKCVRSTNANGGPNCRLNSSICHKKAKCLLDGTCKCINGYDGDGISSCEPEGTTKTVPEEDKYVITTQAAESKGTTSATLEEIESTTLAAVKETLKTKTTKASTNELTTSSREPAIPEGPAATVSPTESIGTTVVSSTQSMPPESKKTATRVTEETGAPITPKEEETTTSKSTQSEISTLPVTIKKTGGALPPTEERPQYEVTEIEKTRPPGAVPTSENELTGITVKKTEASSSAPSATYTASSSHPPSHASEPFERFPTASGKPSVESSKNTSKLVESSSRLEAVGVKESEQEYTEHPKEVVKVEQKESAGQKVKPTEESKETSEEGHAGGTGTKHEVGTEVTGGKHAGESGSGETHAKMSEVSSTGSGLAAEKLSGSKVMMGIGVERTGKVSGGGVASNETGISSTTGDLAGNGTRANGTAGAEGEDERTVVKITIGEPMDKSTEKTAETVLSAKINGRLGPESGVAKTDGEIESGAAGERTQFGISIGKTAGESVKGPLNGTLEEGSTSLAEKQETKDVQLGGSGKLSEEEVKSQKADMKQVAKEGDDKKEKAAGEEKASERENKSPTYRTHFIQRCTASDSSPCHENAECETASGHCVCKTGYYGDGYSSCTKITQDCVVDADACDVRAVCDVASRKCKCLEGYVGDGLTCYPDVLDCVLRPNLCSDFATCIGRRCVCNDGYTGDGSSCVSLEPVAGCWNCDLRAECINGICKCAKSYFGNGETCFPDPTDCVHYPGLCHRNAICNEQSRRCQCLQGFLGDGLDCSHQISCLKNLTICDEDADCLPSGVCQCRRGFTGNGVFCNAAVLINAEEATSAPKIASIGCERGCGENEECFSGRCHCQDGFQRNDRGRCIDIDECSLPNACHPVAICVNLPGSYACTCPEGYKGDGRTCLQYHRINSMAVECEFDGMTLILTNESELFDGRIFVRGQTENPYCSKRFSSVVHNESDYRFTVPFSHCNIRFEEPDTFAVTVVVQRHPMFITQTADAYDLRCTYPVGTRQVSYNRPTLRACRCQNFVTN
ncbi:unnamed protein product [Toxocara canis]|uniref:EGF-like domain-containing protein n=1 Tax=Toxocara canis TaxID=6265 RepID=A0A183UX43_TOXCA|nr:unnamed protein product [Toxocara canis]